MKARQLHDDDDDPEQKDEAKLDDPEQNDEAQTGSRLVQCQIQPWPPLN